MDVFELQTFRFLMQFGRKEKSCDGSTRLIPEMQIFKQLLSSHVLQLNMATVWFEFSIKLIKFEIKSIKLIFESD